MNTIVTYLVKPYRGDFTNVRFVDAQGMEYRLNSNIFLVRERTPRQFMFLKNEYKDFFAMIGKNPPFIKYEVELNNKQEIINIMELPLQTQYLTNFYTTNKVADNYALAVQKFGRFVENKLEYMNAARTGLFHKYGHNSDLIADLSNKQTRNLEILKETNEVVTLELKQHWRMALGLGNASVYNNGFTFHPVYGIPYIPGQNVKGIVRSYIINEFYNEISPEVQLNDKIKSKKEHMAELDPMFCHFFGCSHNSNNGLARKGKLNFLDAFPINNFNIEPDIMNPHYSEYYSDVSNTIAPHDAMKLTPIVFLTIKNATFSFGCYLNKRDNKERVVFLNQTEFIVALMQQKMKEALEIKGIGAKTKVGYGRFK